MLILKVNKRQNGFPSCTSYHLSKLSFRATCAHPIKFSIAARHIHFLSPSLIFLLDFFLLFLSFSSGTKRFRFVILLRQIKNIINSSPGWQLVIRLRRLRRNEKIIEAAERNMLSRIGIYGHIHRP